MYYLYITIFNDNIYYNIYNRIVFLQLFSEI